MGVVLQHLLTLKHLVTDGVESLVPPSPALTEPTQNTAPKSPRKTSRFRRVFRAAKDLFPLRILALLILALSALSLFQLAYAEQDLAFFVVGYGGLALVALCVLAVLIGAIVLRAKTRPDGAEHAATHSQHMLETGAFYTSGVTIPSLRFFPLVQVAFEIEDPAALEAEHTRDGGKLVERIKAQKRGRFTDVIRRLVVQDPFGLSRIAFRRSDNTTIDVLPHVGKLSQTPTLFSLIGGEDLPHPSGSLDGDRVELRRYAPGDPARFIHWKIFSRTRRLMVRMPERALMQTVRTVAYLVAGDGDEASAACARLTVARGMGEDWAFSASGAEVCSTVEQSEDAILLSANAHDRGAGLQMFLRAMDQSGPATLLLFVPATPGEWLKTVVSILGQRQGRVLVVIGVDGVALEQSSSLLRRAFVDESQSRDERTSAADLSEVVAALRPVSEVHVFDRVSGRPVSEVEWTRSESTNAPKFSNTSKPSSKAGSKVGSKSSAQNDESEAA